MPTFLASARRHIAPLIALCSIAAAPALAQLHAGDVVLSVSNSALQIGSSSGGSQVSEGRVFSSFFGEQGVPLFTTNPGFNTLPGQFPASQLFGVQLTRALRKWTPATATSPANFCTIAPETVTVYRSGSLFRTTPSADPTTAPPSLTIGQTNSTGFVHTHPTFGLNAPVGQPAPSDGVYMVELVAWVTSPTSSTTAPSSPFYVVLGQNAPQGEIDAASAWLTSQFASGGSGSFCPPVAPACRADANSDTVVNIDDIFVFLGLWFAQDPRASMASPPTTPTVDDIFIFLGFWFAGC